MYQRILAAVDDSPASDRALQEAINLAKDQRAALRIVHVVDEMHLYSETQFVDPAEIDKIWREAARKVLDKAQAAARFAGVEAEARLLEIGSITERMAGAIAAEAGGWPADLIVAGTHGRGGLNHLLLGSVAEGIVRASPVPVLLVRSR